jgi:hypothetical protein
MRTWHILKVICRLTFLEHWENIASYKMKPERKTGMESHGTL